MEGPAATCHACSPGAASTLLAACALWDGRTLTCIWEPVNWLYS